MQLSSLRKSTVGKSVLVDEPTIIMFFPSSFQKVWKSIYNTGFLLGNCRGIVVPNKNIFFNNKKLIKGKIHFLEMKKQMVELKNVIKKLQVLPSIKSDNKVELEKTSSISKGNKFYFYDLTLLKDGIEYIQDKFPERKLISIFFNELNKKYNEIKEEHPTSNVLLVFDVQNKNDFIYNILVNIRKIKSIHKDDISKVFFDKFLFVSLNGKLIPVAEYVDKEFVPNLQMINRLDSFIEAKESAEEINGVPAISDKEVDDEVTSIIPSTSVASKIIDSLKDPFAFSNIDQQRKNFVEVEPGRKSQIVKPDAPPKVNALSIKATPENDNVKIELDAKTLTKVMKYYKVTNPDVIANIKTAIDKYINETGEVPTKANAEKLVLKAVNRSLHGTDEIDETYLANPALLFNQLKNLDVFSVPLEFPKKTESLPFEINEVVTLKSTTGQFRQKLEFMQNIHENIEKVFKSLEKQQHHPIKINNITHKYIDTDTDRYIEYTINVSNLDGNKKTYDLKLNIPTVINDKYFKLGGNRYIFATQQHLKPLTHTDKFDVRFLTNYAIIRLSVENLKFNVADINDILNYIQQRYPNLIVSASDKEVAFNDGDKIYLVGESVYDGLNSTIVYDENNNLVDKKGIYQFKNNNRFEFLYDLVLEKIQRVNIEDKLTKTKKSIPYIAVYMSGIKIPFIIFMWFQKGLLSTLNQFGINYAIVDDEPATGDIFLELEDGKYLALYPSTIREKLIVNGLLVQRIKYPIKSLDDPEEIAQHINNTYGARTIFLINNLVSNIIDPITNELLEYENYPTNLPGILAGPALDMLLNKKPDQLTDLKLYRTRMSEIVLRILYKQLSRAANSYSHKVDFGDSDAKLMIVPDYVINEFLNKNPPDQSVEKTAGSMLTLSQSVNPIDELLLSSKVIKLGPGGLRSKDELKPAHRNIHVSHIGNMSAIATPESADVGITTHHTLSPLITNKYGSYGLKDPDSLTGWDTLAINEALIPLSSEVYSDRLVLATTHSGQVNGVA